MCNKSVEKLAVEFVNGYIAGSCVSYDDALTTFAEALADEGITVPNNETLGNGLTMLQKSLASLTAMNVVGGAGITKQLSLVITNVWSVTLEMKMMNKFNKFTRMEHDYDCEYVLCGGKCYCFRG